MILYATFVLYYLINTVEHKNNQQTKYNTTDAGACQANQQHKGRGKHSQRKNKLNN